MTNSLDSRTLGRDNESTRKSSMLTLKLRSPNSATGAANSAAHGVQSPQDPFGSLLSLSLPNYGAVRVDLSSGRISALKKSALTGKLVYVGVGVIAGSSAEQRTSRVRTPVVGRPAVAGEEPARAPTKVQEHYVPTPFFAGSPRVTELPLRKASPPHEESADLSPLALLRAGKIRDVRDRPATGESPILPGLNSLAPRVPTGRSIVAAPPLTERREPIRVPDRSVGSETPATGGNCGRAPSQSDPAPSRAISRAPLDSNSADIRHHRHERSLIGPWARRVGIAAAAVATLIGGWNLFSKRSVETGTTSRVGVPPSTTVAGNGNRVPDPRGSTLFPGSIDGVPATPSASPAPPPAVAASEPAPSDSGLGGGSTVTPLKESLAWNFFPFPFQAPSGGEREPFPATPTLPPPNPGTIPDSPAPLLATADSAPVPLRAEEPPPVALATPPVVPSGETTLPPPSAPLAASISAIAPARLRPLADWLDPQEVPFVDQGVRAKPNDPGSAFGLVRPLTMEETLPPGEVPWVLDRTPVSRLAAFTGSSLTETATLGRSQFGLSNGSPGESGAEILHATLSEDGSAVSLDALAALRVPPPLNYSPLGLSGSKNQTDFRDLMSPDDEFAVRTFALGDYAPRREKSKLAGLTGFGVGSAAVRYDAPVQPSGSAALFGYEVSGGEAKK